MKSASRKPQPKRKYFKSRGFSRLFCFSWEQRKYGDVVETRRGLTYKPSDICDSGIRVLRSSNIDEDTFVLKADDVFVKKDAVNIDYSKENDILITSANGSSRLVGKHAIISSISGNPAVHGGFMLLGTTKEPYFINASMGSSWYRRFIELYVAGGNGAIGNLNKNDLDNQVILIPSEPEQRAIGAYFKQLDNLITLHQRDSIMRFFGAWDNANAWEQRKLGEVIRLNGRIGFRGYTEKDIVSKDDGGVLTFSPTNIVDNKLTTNCKNTYITRFKYDESPEIKIHNGDILFVKTGSTLGKSALVTGLSEDATLNPQVVVMRTNNLNVEFLAAMLVTNAIISQVNSAKIGGAVPTLTETRIKDFDVAIPVSEAEKEQIGQFFSQLDHLITLHQRERKNRLFGGKNVKQYNFSRSVLQLLRAMDTRLQRRGCSQGDYG